MDGFQKRKQLKSLAILATSLQYFKQNGMKKTSLTQIAQQSNVSKATILNYYQSKENLIIQTFKYHISQRFEEYEQVINQTNSFKDKISSLLFLQDPNQNIHQEFIYFYRDQLNSSESDICQFYMEKRDAFYLQFFEHAKKTGEIDSHFSNEILMFYLKMMINGIKHYPSYIKLDQFSDDIVELFLHGVSTYDKKNLDTSSKQE
ncbi:TetR/AcrR family transcriptional regulator [Alkalihalobacillus pseudalcaliphilus]|uniref:TetR/AcrR family transcriptional regulator n=1 Tax=Alkalihalobacillus pseudalcaliphilus TaxID=79884 RepID=UPI00064D9497|nr:TetR/AcrR family transcriptional regulator [Alkalihalobacillus pseudalcaliphilus]KMK76236.1 hypothetical protein AB990_13570 [Alkalihalobacillus pseudalcaliphilus]